MIFEKLRKIRGRKKKGEKEKKEMLRKREKIVQYYIFRGS